MRRIKNGGVQRRLTGSLLGTRQIYLCGAVSAYQETIPKVHTPGYPGTAAQLLQEVTGIVMQEHPDMVVISVNDDRKLSAPPEHTLNVELVERYAN